MSSWCAAAVLAIGVVGAAPTEPSVELVVRDCPSLDEAVLHRITGIELGGTEVGLTVATATTRVVVACSESAVEIEVADAVTNKSLQRAIDAAGLGQGTDERIIALAVAELVSASWLELRIDPDPAPSVELKPRPSPSEEIRARALELAEARIPLPLPRPRWRVGAGVGPRWLPTQGIHLMTGRVDARRGFGRSRVFALAAGMEATGGRAIVAAGDVRLATVAPFVVGYAHVRQRLLSIDTGVGVRGGWVLLQGLHPRTASRPLRHDTGWLEPFVEAVVSAQLHPTLSPFAGVDVGWVVVGAGGRENGREVIRFGGPTVGARIGLAGWF